jgi:secreted trypsin-like serine protease
MRTKWRVAVLAIVVAVALSAATVLAIRYGEFDGNRHPYVGLMVAQAADGTPLWRCSGTLLSSTLFLTAGHCTEAPAAHVEIWFQTDVQSGAPANGYPYTGQVGGTPVTHPLYNPSAFFRYDLGVVELDAPMEMPEYGALPQLNQLDLLKNRRGQQEVGFTAVGYGMQASFPDPVAWKDQSYKIRMVSYPHLVQINVPGYTGDFSMLLSNNANTGGTCFGDSGGPNFIGTSNVIAGVTSYARNGNCTGTGGVYRVDRADDLDWLATFGVIPHVP